MISFFFRDSSKKLINALYSSEATITASAIAKKGCSATDIRVANPSPADNKNCLTSVGAPVVNKSKKPSAAAPADTKPSPTVRTALAVALSNGDTSTSKS